MFDRLVMQPLTDDDSLEAGAFCVQNWRSSFVADFDKLEDLYKPRLGNFGPGPLTEEQIGILYCYTSALARIAPIESNHSKMTPILLINLAVLLHHTSHRCRQTLDSGPLGYNTAVRAFAFSTELVAKYLFQGKTHRNVLLAALGFDSSQHEPGTGYDTYMDDAIKVLHRGDTDCQIRASELSRRLARWLKSPQPKSKSSQNQDKNQNQSSPSQSRAQNRSRRQNQTQTQPQPQSTGKKK